MQLVLLSDIHGNYNALKSIFNHIQNTYKKDFKFVFLGDYINYGMRSNEVVSFLSKISINNILVRLKGNHEEAVLNGNIDEFSSERGRQSVMYTKNILTKKSINWLNTITNAKIELDFFGKKILFVHGNFEDELWGKLDATEMQKEYYAKYDFVFSGHSHIPYFYECFYEDRNSIKRKRKKTIFVNSGSVGQPRNHNPKAQYAVVNLETEDCFFHKVDYDIAGEMRFFTGQVAEFYRDRLNLGI